jgi:hypothetical protein
MAETRRPKPAKSGHLSARQQRVLAALLVSPSLQSAASNTGVGERTIRRWLSDDALFQSAYQVARRQLLDQSMLVLQRAVGMAVRELILELQSQNESIRHKSACVILDRSERWLTMEFLESRIQTLEELVNGVNTLERRTRALEEATGGDGECRCQPQIIRVRYPDDARDDPSPTRCARCGRMRRPITIRIVYDDDACDRCDRTES